MTTAHINVETTEVAGRVGVSFMAVYVDGFDPTNPAHQFVQALVTKADEIGERIGEPSVVTGEPCPIEVDAHPILVPGSGPVYPVS